MPRWASLPGTGDFSLPPSQYQGPLLSHGIQDSLHPPPVFPKQVGWWGFFAGVLTEIKLYKYVFMTF